MKTNMTRIVPSEGRSTSKFTAVGYTILHKHLLCTPFESDHHVTPISQYFQLYPFPKRQILDFSKLIEFADDNFNFDENG